MGEEIGLAGFVEGEKKRGCRKGQEWRELGYVANVAAVGTGVA